jgi:hypothetical protein
MQEEDVRRSWSEAGSVQKQDTLSVNSSKEGRGWGGAQVTEHLASKCKVLNLNPITDIIIIKINKCTLRLLNFKY